MTVNTRGYLYDVPKKKGNQNIMTLIKAEKSEKSTYLLEFSVDKETFDATVNKVYRKQVANINIPGFRKGKAPRSVVERMYGKGVFYEDAANELLPDAYEAALSEAGIEPVGRAEFDITSIDENGILFTATVPVKPEVTIEGYKSIDAAKVVDAVTEDEIDVEIRAELKKNSRETEITDETVAAAMGDKTVIDFEGFLDDVAFEGGKGTDYPLELGSGSFIPGFEEQVAGHTIGEQFDVNVTFPEEYHAEELAGKAVVFKVTLKKLTKIEFPALDDDFAKDVSEFDTYAEYRADIEAKILKKHEEEADYKFEETVIKALNEMLGGEEIPAAMIDNEVENQVRNYDNRLRSNGLDLKTFLGYTGQTLESLREQFRPQAESIVKTRLALEKIAELENIVPTEEEIEAEYIRAAEMYKIELDEFKKLFPADALVSDLKTKAAMDLVKANASAKAE